MKQRKTIDRKPIEEWLDRAIERYEQETGLKYNPRSGFVQVPKDNLQACMTYEQIATLRSVLEEY